MIRDFELNELFNQCKQNLSSMKRRAIKKDATSTVRDDVTKNVPDRETTSDAADDETVSGKEKTA